MLNLVIDISSEADFFIKNPDWFYDEIEDIVSKVKTTKIDVIIDDSRCSLMECVIKFNNEKSFNYLIKNGEDNPANFFIEKDVDGKEIDGILQVNEKYNLSLFKNSNFGKVLFFNALKKWLSSEDNNFDRKIKESDFSTTKIPFFILNDLSDLDSFKLYYEVIVDKGLKIDDYTKKRLLRDAVNKDRNKFLVFLLEKDLVNVDNIISTIKGYDLQDLLKNEFLSDSLIFKKFVADAPDLVLSSFNSGFLEKISSVADINYIKSLGYDFDKNVEDLFGVRDILLFKKIVEWTMPNKLLEEDFVNSIFSTFKTLISGDTINFMECVEVLISLGVSPNKYDFLIDAYDIEMDKVNYLVGNGMNVEGSLIVKKMIKNNNIKSLNTLYKNGFDIVTTDNFYYALKSNANKEMIKWFLKKGIDVYGETKFGKLAFFGISNKRDLSLIREHLSSNGFELNLEIKSSKGNNFLNDFMSRGAAKGTRSNECLRSDDLLDEIIIKSKIVDSSGVDLNNNTVLHFLFSGTKSGTSDYISINFFNKLIKYSNISESLVVKNNEGDTPIHILFKKVAGNFRVVGEHFIEEMPIIFDLSVINNEGKTPIECLRESDINGIVFAQFYDFYLNNKLPKVTRVNDIKKI